MGNITGTIDEIDNTGTLYEDVLKLIYSGDELNIMLTNIKFLRINILKMIKDFVDKEQTICIKEFSDNPIMAYADSERYNYNYPELSTDLVIVNKAFNLPKILEHAQKVTAKYPLVLEALDPNNVSKESWNDLLDEIYLLYNDEDNPHNDRVHKIVIEDTVNTLKKWGDTSDSDTKEMIKAYNRNYGINQYNTNTFWQEPLDLISKKYWEKFSFVLVINDYDIYNPDTAGILEAIAQRYYENGYFDEVVIMINYFYWFDDFQKIVDWSSENLKSALVSYRFDTVFKYTEKNRYFDEAEAAKYNDIQRKNTMNEELDMLQDRMPILLEKILTNPQTYGFELNDGYFGLEGDVPIPDLTIDSDEFDRFKNTICKMLAESPFSSPGDAAVKIFRDPKKRLFVCIKGYYNAD